MLKTRPALMKASLGSGDSTAPSSNTSPVLMSFAARRTVSGFIMLPEPRWSPAPHLDGHRWLSGGICHVWALSAVVPSPNEITMVVAVMIGRTVPSWTPSCGRYGKSCSRGAHQVKSGTRSATTIARRASVVYDFAMTVKKFEILVLNQISQVGLKRFPEKGYKVSKDAAHPDAILVRLHDMNAMKIAETVRAIGRAGAG